jgi:gliding motility-associatede transport system auxiliary component
MAMRTATPWWASLTLGIGLFFFLLGERFFGHLPGARFVLTGFGLLLIFGITGARAWAMLGSAGARRRVERTLLVCHAGTLLALFLYLWTTDWGLAKLGLIETSALHFQGAVTVLYLAVLFASIIPLLMVELSLGLALRTGFDVQPGPGNEEAGVEYFRVREIGWSGLTVGLALSFLMVTCQVANERNVQRDVSYFKTSSPGDSTRKIVATSSDSLRVLLFFPEVNEVKNQVRGYFEALAAATGKLGIEFHDRLTDADIAGKYKVTKDGVMVFVRGTGDKEKSQTLDVEIDTAKLRSPASKLRNLDREVNSVLLKLMRDKRKAYITVGHGEVNDPESIPAEFKGRIGERQTTQFKKRLGDLNYEIKNLGVMDLAKEVPDDATLVIVFAPTVPLQPDEWSTLVRYLDRGGHLMLVLDPTGDTSMGPLEGKFAFKMMPGHLTDEQIVLRGRGGIADRRFTATNQFSAHASTGSLSRLATDQGLRLLDAGAFDDLPYTGKPEDAPKKTITIRSMESSFMDYNDNYTFDATGPTPEKKQKWNIAAAVEGPKRGDKDGYRALLFADADLFIDLFGRNQMGQLVSVLASQTLLDDSVKWLGGEEAIVGDVVSEDDKPIQHTKNEDVVWFTLMIIGAPIIVLTLGLVGTSARRRRGSKKAEVTL